MQLSENTKVILTLKQLRALVESIEDDQLRQLVQEVTLAQNAEEVTDESIQSAIGLSLIAGLLSLGGILRADDVKSSLRRATSASQAQAALNVASVKTYGRWTAAQATNILMRTMYDEARGESALGKKYVATVLWNRAGGDVNKLADVCLKRKQFSGWNDVAGKDPSTYQIKVPDGATKVGADQDAWNACKGLVEQLLNGTFTPVGDYNVYLNKATADKSAVNGWAKKMTGQVKVGKHTFGYLPEHDGFKSGGGASTYATTCKVQKGDYGVSYVAQRLIKNKQTRYTDAKKLTAEILKLNKLKKDKRGNPIIRVGDTLKLPT